MLSIGKVTPGRADYYEKSVARGRDDYYSGKGEAPGTWTGRGARALGLNGQIEAARFNAMIAGLDPSDPTLRRALLSKERAVRTINGKRHESVAAYDLTFSAPKSVSVLFATTDTATARHLVAAHDQAVRAALDYLEDRAVYTRRGRNGCVVEQGDGLIAAAYRHRMSRSKDPQLHTHVVAANLVRTPSDGQWRSLHATVIYRHARTAGVLYQAHLRAEVRDRLGVTWGPVVKGAGELDGIPNAVLREFSQRRIQIEQAAQEHGAIALGSKAGAEALALKTRDRKDHTVRTADWRLDIEARAQEHGFGPSDIDRLLAEGRDRLADTRPHVDPVVIPAASARESHESEAETTLPADRLADRLTGPHGLTALQNTFGEREALTTIAEHYQQGLRAPETRTIVNEVLRRPDVLDVRPVESAGIPERRFTADDLVECERRLVAAAVERRETGTALVDSITVDRALAAAARPLTAEQEQVVRGIVSSGNGVEVIQALAGTGKTFTAGVLHEVYTRAGVEVLGVAPTGRAARELGEVGIPARTLHATMASLDRYPELGLPQGAVVILDEAGMAPTRLTARFLHAARQVDAKVIAIGDSGQLPSVQAGGWMHQVGQQVGSQHLTGVQRQRDPQERRMLGLLHDQTTGGDAYLTWLDGRGRLDIDTETPSLIARAIDSWSAAVAEHGIDQAVLIARDQQTRQILNDQARARHADHEGLGDQRRYGTVLVAIGDRVIARLNDYEVDVDNGTRGTVTHVHPSGIEVRTDGGTTRSLPASYVEDHLEHAYALTGHGMQGATVQWAAVVARPEHLTRGWSYTALSRAREETRLYVPAIDQLRQEDRADIAPHDTVEIPERTETIHRIALRMRERDDEDLAVSQLIDRQPRAGGSYDPHLNPPTANDPDVPQEHAARDAEPPVIPSDHAELVRLTRRVRELEQQRDPVLLRRLGGLDDLDAERQRTTEQRDRALQRLAALPESPAPRFRNPSDQHAAQRAALTATIAAAEERLAANDRDHQTLRAELGVDPDEVRAEHRDRETAIGQLDRQRTEAGDRIVQRIVDESPEWVVERFGARPADPTAAQRWDDTVRTAVRGQLDGTTASPNDVRARDMTDARSHPASADRGRPGLDPPDL